MVCRDAPPASGRKVLTMIIQEGFKRLQADCLSTGLCYECGACEVACPNGALRLRQYKFCRNPELVNNCVNEHCDSCYRACAPLQWSLREFSRS